MGREIVIYVVMSMSLIIIGYLFFLFKNISTFNLSISFLLIFLIIFFCNNINLSTNILLLSVMISYLVLFLIGDVRQKRKENFDKFSKINREDF